MKNIFLQFTSLSGDFGAVSGNLVLNSALYRGLGKSVYVCDFMHVLQRDQEIAYGSFFGLFFTEKSHSQI